jgi:hypothetical protein
LDDDVVPICDEFDETRLFHETSQENTDLKARDLATDPPTKVPVITK